MGLRGTGPPVGKHANVSWDGSLRAGTFDPERREKVEALLEYFRRTGVPIGSARQLVLVAVDEMLAKWAQHWYPFFRAMKEAGARAPAPPEEEVKRHQERRLEQWRMSRSLPDEDEPYEER